jgi:hypothetical protein
MISKLRNYFKNLSYQQNNLHRIRINQGIYLSGYIKNFSLEDLDNYGFGIFSQFNEDSIIQYFISKIDFNRSFIEIGTENYEEANTRFLLEKDNWSGLIIDSSKKNLDFVEKQNYFWRHDLTTHHATVGVENINSILSKSKFTNNVGILSIDIDGNDYWVWEAIKIITPQLVIIEYNSKFGDQKSLTIKYEKDFLRSKEGLDKLIYGASLSALNKLGNSKGYSLVCTNKNGNNAFFLNNKYLNNFIKQKTIKEVYKKSYFREYLTKDFKNSLDEDYIYNYITSSKKVVEV